MLYFAYGSNMDFTQMRERCPSASFICRACLRHYRLAFTRRSTKRECGVADVVPEEGSETWGVVYDIPEAEINGLDTSEGYRSDRAPEDNAYVRKETKVLRDGKAEQSLEVCVYFANAQAEPPLPNSEYKRLIVEGAKHWKLPAEYIAQLNLIATAE